jgi:prolyl oligopeptidase
MAYPASRRDDVVDTIHGVAVADPYRWLEDGASAETRAWIRAQQEYAAPCFDTLERERLSVRLAALIKVDSVKLPIERNGGYFFMRRPADSPQGLVCRRRGLNGADEVLIDPNPLDAGYLISAEILDVTPDGSLLAYALRRGAADVHEIRVLDVASRRELADVLPSGRYYQNLSWRHDNSGFYYSMLAAEQAVVRFHRLGTEPTSDREVFAAPSEKFLHAGSATTVVI